MLAQFALTGDVDMTQALAAAIGAGGKQALDEFALSADLTEDELQQFFAEDDELQQAAIDADIKDPFLNPNYSTVGDGLMVDTDGNVFNYDGENMGTMDELDTNNDGMLTGSDLQEVSVDVEETDFGNQTFDGWLDYSSSGTPNAGRYYIDSKGTLYHRDNVNLDRNGNWVVDGGANDGQIIDGNLTQVYVNDGVITNEDGGLVEWQSYYDDRADDGVQYENIIGPDDQVMGDELVGAPSDSIAPGDYVNSEGQNVQYLGTQYGYVDENGNWVAGTVGQETDIYYNLDTQQYETKDGAVINFTEEPPETEPVEPIEETKTDEPAPDPLQSEDEQLEGATGEPATGAEPGGSSLEQLTEQLQQAIAAGDFELANEISEQIDQLEADQQFDDLQPESAFEDEKESGDIVDADGTIQQPTGRPTINIPMPADNKTEWQKNKDYIVEKVNAGEATEGQQEWYDKWIESGSPETKDGMSSGTGAGETPATGDGGGIVGDGETGAPGETEKPNVIGVGGPTIGSGPSPAPMPGMFDKGTGDPDIGQGPGGTGEGGEPEEGMLTQQSDFSMPEFKPFNFSLNYQTPEMMPIISSGQKDYSKELDGIIGRSLFKGII
jgi:hypothetical protein